MDDNIQMVPIDDLSFTKRTDALPAELIDRIVLIHNVFRDYLSVTLEKTIDNFKYDINPEQEIRVWEHMASVILALKYQENWPADKIALAVKVVLGLSMGAVQDNELNVQDTDQIKSLWNKRTPR